MINPCYDCPKYREYGKYLDDILICKTPVSEPESGSEQDHVVKKNKPTITKITMVTKSVVKAKPKAQPQSGPCKMGGCKRQAEIKGYCNSCLAVRKYHEVRGNEPPDSLTPAQIKRRDRKGI